jgi:hypothetical protein
MRRQVRRLTTAALLLATASLLCAPGVSGADVRAVTVAGEAARAITVTRETAPAVTGARETATVAREAATVAREATTTQSTPTTRPTTGTAAPPEITLPLSPSGPVAHVAMRPVGLSLEYPTMAQDLGTGACPPPALVAELRQLGSPPLALSGDSQDLTIPSGVTLSPPTWETATLYTLPATFWSQLHCLLSEAGDPLDAGLNLRTGPPAWAAQIAAGAASAATNGLEFSLGNEPDLYSQHNYASLAEPLPHAEATAVNLYLQLASALEPTLGGQPVVGPELAIPARWRHSLPRVIAQLHEHVVGVHMYPLTACNGPGEVTIPRLLSSAAADAPSSLAWVVADAAAAGVPAIISEANSASCGGAAGVSDSPAAAVWAVGYVLDALETGFQEVRFHFSDGSYDPFLVDGDAVLNRPLESALVALNQWLPVGASIQTLPHVHGLVATAIGAAPSTPQPSGGGASAAQSDTPQLILDNESTKPQTVVLRGVPTVQVQLLSATRAGLQATQLSSPRDRIKLTVPASSVLAVLS